MRFARTSLTIMMMPSTESCTKNKLHCNFQLGAATLGKAEFKRFDLETVAWAAIALQADCASCVFNVKLLLRFSAIGSNLLSFASFSNMETSKLFRSPSTAHAKMPLAEFYSSPHADAALALTSGL